MMKQGFREVSVDIQIFVQHKNLERLKFIATDRLQADCSRCFSRSTELQALSHGLIFWEIVEN